MFSVNKPNSEPEGPLIIHAPRKRARRDAKTFFTGEFLSQLFVVARCPSQQHSCSVVLQRQILILCTCLTGHGPLRPGPPPPVMTEVDFAALNLPVATFGEISALQSWYR